jgi:hypothetical protein
VLEVACAILWSKKLDRRLEPLDELAFLVAQLLLALCENGSAP